MRLRPYLQPFKLVWEKSWTKLWGYSQMAGSAVLMGISELNTLVSNETVKDYLNMIDVPKSVLLAIATLGLITWLAHGRSDA